MDEPAKPLRKHSRGEACPRPALVASHLAFSIPTVFRQQSPESLGVARAAVGSSVAQDHQVKLAKALGVGKQVDCDDFPARDREAEDDTRLSASESEPSIR
jgi:hypothetical protein